MKKEKMIIKSNMGLHMRPASEIVKVTNKFSCKIQVKVGEKVANAKSILGIMSTGAKNNDEIEIKCDGEDEEKAMTEIMAVLENQLT